MIRSTEEKREMMSQCEISNEVGLRFLYVSKTPREVNIYFKTVIILSNSITFVKTKKGTPVPR